VTGPEFTLPGGFAVSWDTTATLELLDMDGHPVSVPLVGIPDVVLDPRAYSGRGYSVTGVALRPTAFTLRNPDGSAYSVAMDRTVLKADGYEVEPDYRYRERQPDGRDANGRPYWY
jgi:hypothetical protein